MSDTSILHSFFTALQMPATYAIPNNPFYFPTTREIAAGLVSRFNGVILRDSSRAGLYAVTYYCLTRRMIVHTLLAQNADLSVDVLTDSGSICEHYANIYDLLALILWGPSSAPARMPTGTGPLVTVAPPPPTPIQAQSRPAGDEDPV